MHRSWRLLLKVLLILACLLYLGHSLRTLGPGEVLAVAKKCHPGWLLLSILPLGARFWIWSLKWQFMVKRQGPLSFSLSNHLVMAAAFINLVTPTAKLGGAFFRAIYLRQRMAFRASRAYGWVFADQMAHLLGNILLLGILLALTPWMLPGLGHEWLFWGLGAACIGIAAVFLMVRARLWQKAQFAQLPKVIRRWFSTRLAGIRSNRATDSIPQFLWPWLGSGKPRQFLTIELALSGLSFAMLGLANAWVLKALGAEVHWLAVLLVVMLAYLGGSVLGIMGGIGVTEVFLLKCYPLIGITETYAAAGALLHRALFYLFVLTVGGWSFWVLRRDRGVALVDVAQ